MDHPAQQQVANGAPAQQQVANGAPAQPAAQGGQQGANAPNAGQQQPANANPNIPPPIVAHNAGQQQPARPAIPNDREEAPARRNAEVMYRFATKSLADPVVIATDADNAEREGILSPAMLKRLKTLRMIVTEVQIRHVPRQWGIKMFELEKLESVCKDDEQAKIMLQRYQAADIKLGGDNLSSDQVQTRVLLETEQRKQFKYFDAFLRAKKARERFKLSYDSDKPALKKELQEKFINLMKQHCLSPDDALLLQHIIFPDSDFDALLFAQWKLDGVMTPENVLEYHNWNMASKRPEGFVEEPLVEEPTPQELMTQLVRK